MRISLVEWLIDCSSVCDRCTARPAVLSTDGYRLSVKVEILLSGLWDPSSGNLFAEEGDQQRFWKITRKFVEQMAAVCGGNVKAV